MPRKREVNIQKVREVATQISGALAYLHSQNVVHQDIKPANILFSRDRQVIKLCDLGISNKVDITKATKRANAGTLRYMSPEQLDEQLNTKIDIWALGCVLL